MLVQQLVLFLPLVGNDKLLRVTVRFALAQFSAVVLNTHGRVLVAKFAGEIVRLQGSIYRAAEPGAAANTIQ